MHRLIPHTYFSFLSPHPVPTFLSRTRRHVFPNYCAEANRLPRFPNIDHLQCVPTRDHSTAPSIVYCIPHTLPAGCCMTNQSFGTSLSLEADKKNIKTIPKDTPNTKVLYVPRRPDRSSPETFLSPFNNGMDVANQNKNPAQLEQNLTSAGPEKFIGFLEPTPANK